MENVKAVKKRGISLKGKVFPIIGIFLLSLYTVLFLTPFLWMIMTSLKSDVDFTTNIFGIPKKWLFSNYVTIFNSISVTVMDPSGYIKHLLPSLFMNSLVYALGCAVVHTISPCITAYAVSKYNFKFSRFVYGIVIVTMLLPIVGSLPSMLRVMRMLKLYDTFTGILIMRFGFLGINFLILYGAFKSISWEYAESGFVDGASHFRVMIQIIMPLALPVIGVIFLLNFITYWNEFYTPMIFLPSMPVLSLGVFRFAQSTETLASSIPMKMAGCVVAFVPTLLLFLVFRDKLTKNLSVGGIKG